MKKLLPLLSLALAGFATPQAQAAPTDAAADSIDVRFTVTDEKGQPAEGFYIVVYWYDEDGNYVGAYPSGYVEDVDYITDASGQAVLRVPAGQAFYQWQVRDEGYHYYQLHAIATEEQLAEGVNASYEGMHRVDVTATGQFDRTYYDGYGIVFFNAVFTPKGGEHIGNGDYTYVGMYEYDENGGKGYVICPDGYLNILCLPTMADGIRNYATRTIQVDGKDTAVHFDMTEAYPITVTATGWTGEEQPNISISDKTNVRRFGIDTDGRLAPGIYQGTAYAVTYDEPMPTQYYYNTRTFELTDGPVELSFDMRPETFHTMTFDVSGAPEDIGFAFAYIDHEAGINLPNPAISNYRTMLTNGTHHYSVVLLHDGMNNLYNCFPIEGEVTLDGADAVVPLDLSGLVFSSIDLGLTSDGFLGFFDSDDFWGGELVAADGRRMSLCSFSQPLYAALAPGRYTLEVVVSPGRLLTSEFTVEEGNNFATIDAALEESTGIGAVEQGGALAARVTPAGIVVTSPMGVARATVYGLDGRAVLTQEAADGETIGTGLLPAGTYVLYLRCGSEARVVKFVK